MFAHQVIEDLKKWDCYDGYDNGARKAIDSIKNAIKFHFGRTSDVISVTGVKKYKDPELFFGDFGYEIKLPYKLCWFDMVSKSNGNKCGALLENMPNGFSSQVAFKNGVIKEFSRPEGFMVYVFGTDQNGDWNISNWSYYVSPNHKQDTYLGDGCYTFETLILYTGEYEYVRKQQLTPSHQTLSMVNLCLMLLNCMNITTETIPAPDKLNKKRKKQGKQPLFSYHTLVIKPVGKRQESIPKHLWENRIHLQRGHFKTYTDEKPLFGHITGRFWWQPHVRGRNKDGIVMKDYKVEANA